MQYLWHTVSQKGQHHLIGKIAWGQTGSMASGVATSLGLLGTNVLKGPQFFGALPYMIGSSLPYILRTVGSLRPDPVKDLSGALGTFCLDIIL